MDNETGIGSTLQPGYSSRGVVLSSPSNRVYISISQVTNGYTIQMNSQTFETHVARTPAEVLDIINGLLSPHA